MAQIDVMMKNLGITKEEALELMAYDKAVEKGESTEYDLSKEQEKEIRKYVNVSEHKKVKRTKTVRENPEKEQIVVDIATCLRNFSENVIITNKSREITFNIGENDYKLTLTATRKAKN